MPWRMSLAESVSSPRDRLSTQWHADSSAQSEQRASGGSAAVREECIHTQPFSSRSQWHHTKTHFFSTFLTQTSHVSEAQTSQHISVWIPRTGHRMIKYRKQWRGETVHDEAKEEEASSEAGLSRGSPSSSGQHCDSLNAFGYLHLIGQLQVFYSSEC